MSEVTAYGSEFLVNTNTSGGQYNPRVTGLANGGFAVSWQDNGGTLGDSSSWSVKAQLFDAAGAKVGSEFLVNTSTSDGQLRPTITGLANGGFVVSWQDAAGDSSLGGVKAQVFDAAGHKTGSEFLVNTNTVGFQAGATITGLGDGGFVVSWHDNGGTLGDASGYSVKAQRFDPTGAKVGGEILVNTNTLNDQLSPTITSLSNGGFVISWRDSSGTLGDASSTSIKAQVFDPVGTKVGAEFLVNTNTAGGQNAPTITGLSSGGFVVSWYDSGGTLGDASGYSIKAQVFDAVGTKIGGEFLVNTNTVNDQSNPTITSLQTGGFAISWNDYSGTLGDSSANSVKAQVFDATGAKVGTEFLVNTNTAGYQTAPSIATLADGRFIVSWDDESGTLGDSSGTAIKAQIFVPTQPVTITSNGGGDDATVMVDEREIIATQIIAESGGSSDGIHYAIFGGEDAGLFRIDPDTGLLGFATAPDYEAPGSADGDNLYEVQVRADNGSSSDTQLITVAVQNVNERPVITSDGGGTSASLTVSENSTIVTTVVGSDPDGDQILYRIQSGSNDFAFFTIDGATGVLSFIAGPDYEAPSDFGADNFYRVTVEVTDGTPGWSAFQTIEILVTNVNEAAVITSNGGGDAASVSIAENSTVVATVAASDPDGTTPAYSIAGGDDASLFSIDTSTGALSFIIGPDREAPTDANHDSVYNVIVRASDGTLNDDQAIAVTVTNVNEAPALTSQQASLANGTEDASYTVTETQLLAGFTDVDGDALSIANLSADHGVVTNNGDGTYTVTQAANFNGVVSLSYDVIDGHGGSVSASLGYTIDAVNDAPSLTGSQTALAQGIEDVAYRVTAEQLTAGFSDIDGDAVSVANLAADHGAVINNGDGTYTVTQAANFNGAVSLAYDVADGHGGTVSATLGYTINAVNDAPVLTGSAAALPAGSEDVAYTVTRAQLTSGYTDVDGDSLTVANLSADRGSVVDNGNGTYTITQVSNFNGGVTLTYNVVDGRGGSGSAQLNYLLNPVNDGPTGSVTISGTAATGLQLNASNSLADADGLGAISYQWLLDGTAISGATGSSYVARSSDLGHTVSVVANYTDLGGTAEHVTSAATSAVVRGPSTFTGTSGNDTLNGSNFDDTLNGLAGNDILRGLAGNDVLNGGAGNDLLDGGAGIDSASYADATAGVKVSLAVTGAQNTGGSGSDTLSAIENLVGSNYNDTLTGDAGANRLDGNGGGDTLTGGAGADTFVFDVLTTSGNKDNVKDFVSGTDRIELSTSAFSALAGYGPGQLSAGELVFGTKALTANDHLIYDSKTGNLIYDADGSGAGAAITIAVLTNHPTIQAGDIFLT